MSYLLHGDCLEELKGIDDNFCDLIFLDLPYGQTACKWDCLIDLDKLWIQLMRVKKLHTPIVMTCTTKFGVSLIKSSPKKCPFRYDLVWCKSAACGFLSAKKMPMRKHEMIYLFYEKLPFYDISSHKHKFIKENATGRKGNCYRDGKLDEAPSSQYTPRLPTSLITPNNLKPEDNNCSFNPNGTYGGKQSYTISKNKEDHVSKYDPPLPTSLIQDEGGSDGSETHMENSTSIYSAGGMDVITYNDRKNGESAYNPPLPNSLLEIKSTRGKHSTEKPVALMEWILKYYSKEDDVVLDATMGSGSMGVACKNMKRNFIGIEMDEDIYNTAVDRIEN